MSVGLDWYVPEHNFKDGDGCHEGCTESVLEHGPGCCEARLRGDQEGFEGHRYCTYRSDGEIDYNGQNGGARAVKCQGNNSWNT